MGPMMAYVYAADRKSERCISAIAVDLQDACKVPQMGFGALALAVGRIDIGHHRGHTPIAGRSWSALVLDRALALSSRRQTAARIVAVVPGYGPARGEDTMRTARPSLQGSIDPTGCPAEHRSAPADKAASDRHTWQPAPGRSGLRWGCRLRQYERGRPGPGTGSYCR